MRSGSGSLLTGPAFVLRGCSPSCTHTHTCASGDDVVCVCVSDPSSGRPLCVRDVRERDGSSKAVVVAVVCVCVCVVVLSACGGFVWWRRRRRVQYVGVRESDGDDWEMSEGGPAESSDSA